MQGFFCFHSSLELKRILLQKPHTFLGSVILLHLLIIIPLICEKRVTIENRPVLRFSASWGQTFISLPQNEAGWHLSTLKWQFHLASMPASFSQNISMCSSLTIYTKVNLCMLARQEREESYS